MILGDPSQANSAAVPGGRATIDDLFRHAVARRPSAPALVDPPNRAVFTDGPPRRLSYAEADRLVPGSAGRLRRLGLPTDAIVGIQLPNTVESVLALLGVMRAGMIAAPMPVLWRRADLVTALSRLGARALITCGRVGATDHVDLAMHAAADIFAIRYLCAFGGTLPDGVIPFDDLYTTEIFEPPPPVERPGNPAAHVALVTWDAAADSLVPVARNHMEIIAGGLAILLEGRFEQKAAFLSAIAPSSFAGVTLTMLPWLLTGGTLHLHHPFDPESLAAQLGHGCTAAILPGPVLPRLAEAGFFQNAKDLTAVLGLWRAPERLPAAAPWRDKDIAFLDVLAFGETCIIPMRRGPGGKPAPIPYGPVTAPRGAAGAILVAEMMRTEAGTIAVRGSMVPRHPFPPGAERGALPYFTSVKGMVDTGYTCRVERETRTLVVTGPPAGIVAVGGYRFPLHELQSLVAAAEGAGRLAVLPDALSGQRLAGSADDAAAVQAALTGRGVNPLVARAFAAP
ncbi:MAG: class I adenylate-forming enzyme family protein [Xanthobacteraceae bacterium]